MRWPELFRARATDWAYAEFGPNGEDVPQDVPPDTAYLSVYLRSARVVDIRRGLRRFHAVVNSSITLAHPGGNGTFTAVSAPTALQDLDADRIDRVIQFDRRLLGPAPYVGGDVDVEVGLFSVAGSDLASPYLRLLDMLSELAGVGFLGTALPLSRPIAEGFNLLTGAADASMLEIGLARTFRAPRVGLFAVTRAAADEIGEVRLDDDAYRLLDASGAPMTSSPYMILEVVAAPRRDDWLNIPEVRSAYDDVRAEYRRGRPETIQEAVVAFRRVAVTCNDLLFADGQRLGDLIRERFTDVEPAATRVRGAPAEDTLPPLQTLDPFA